jgi:hypothetical protein
VALTGPRARFGTIQVGPKDLPDGRAERLPQLAAEIGSDRPGRADRGIRDAGGASGADRDDVKKWREVITSAGIREN